MAVLPDRCSVAEDARQCVNPPRFIVSIVVDGGEYMVGVTCERHREVVAGKIRELQGRGRIRGGKVSFAPVKAVGTDCPTYGSGAGEGGVGSGGGLIRIGRDGDPKD